ncbi:MAG: hypothetical protein EXR79_12665 [Myxococcales bacterium]|nr:hypothetical protein [Myxococcales bacterium]
MDRRSFLHHTGTASAGLLATHWFPGCTGSGSPSGASDAATSVDVPWVDGGLPSTGSWWLQGNYSPVGDEIDATALTVIGALPKELAGSYLRNGPNPKSGPSKHWFLGDGMLHGVRLQGGKALRYRNRWANTGLLRGKPKSQPGLPPSIEDTAANTSLVWHADRLLALYEAGLPFEVTADLVSVGAWDFASKLQRSMSAHPKLDPVTGEMFFHSYAAFAPFVQVHRVDAAGKLMSSVEVTGAGPSMMHDMALTQTKAIILDLPVTLDLQLAFNGSIPYQWNPTYQARIGVMDRNGDGKSVAWFDIAPCYVFHVLNAYDAGGTVSIEACRTEKMWVGGPETIPYLPRLWRWTLDLAAKTVKEEQLADVAFEFPQVAPGRVGREHRFGFGLEIPASTDHSLRTGQQNRVLKFDRKTGAVQAHVLGPGRQTDEPRFVPAAGAKGEDEGWLLSFLYDATTNRSELLVLDATNLAAKPVARVLLPRRVPFGFHGLWVADAG